MPGPRLRRRPQEDLTHEQDHHGTEGIRGLGVDAVLQIHAERAQRPGIFRQGIHAPHAAGAETRVRGGHGVGGAVESLVSP